MASMGIPCWFSLLLISWFACVSHGTLKKKEDCQNAPGITPADKMCNSRGTCTLIKSGRYECICGPGNAGSFCEIPDVDDCTRQKKPYCSNHGTCVFVQPNFKRRCKCKEEFTGRECESPMGEYDDDEQDETSPNPCDSNPCPKGEVCQPDKYGEYTCETGKGTRKFKDKCVKSKCPKPSLGAKKCKSLKKVWKEVGTERTQKTMVHELLNKGFDVYGPDGKETICYCPGYLTGQCNRDCSSGTYGHLCLMECNDGCEDTCHVVSGQCLKCKTGWTGKSCETAIPDESLWCKTNKDCNGKGKCVEKNGYKECDCVAGLQSPDCKEECKDGTWGKGCSQQCGNCLKKVNTENGEHGLCNKKNGACIREGKRYCETTDWKPPKCTKIKKASIQFRLRMSVSNNWDEVMISLRNLQKRREVREEMKSSLAKALGSVGKVAITAVAIKLPSQRKRRHLLQSSDSLEVEASATFPQDLTRRTDVQQEIEMTLKEKADEIKIESFPDMAVDKDSISVREVELDAAEPVKQNESNSLTIPYIIGLVAFVIAFIVISVGALYVIKKRDKSSAARPTARSVMPSSRRSGLANSVSLRQQGFNRSTVIQQRGSLA